MNESGSAPVGADIRARALDERLASVLSRLLGVSIVSVLNATLVTWVTLRDGFELAPCLWLAAFVLLSIVRGTLYWRYRADPLKSDHVRYWERVSVIGSLLAGSLWGVGAALIMTGDPTEQWLWSFAIGGMCSGAASLNSAHLPTVLTFTLPACIPLTVTLLLEGTVPGAAGAIMTLAFIAITTLTAILFSREFGRTLSLKFALEQRALELNDINGRLLQEMADHRATSDVLHQAQKMEAIGSLTGGFAHDFNNLLTVIIGNLDLISRRSRDDGIVDLTKAALGAAESGASLTSRLLAFASKQALAPRLVDINRVIADFEALLLHAVSSSIGVEFTFAPQALAAHVDVAHLQAALLNLVVNAKDAMPRGGRILISTARISLAAGDVRGSEEHPGDFIAIAVKDQGEGMSAEVIRKAFEPFFTTKSARGGSGLGLSQVYGFARQSGGFGRIDSVVGQGSCVTLFIPASDMPMPVEEADAADAISRLGRPLPILLVDDNPSVLRILKAGLVGEGWDTIAADHGRAALDLLERDGNIGIVVTDIDMPGEINGLQLEQEIQACWPHIPVLLISGAPIPIAQIEAGVAFLVKPFTVRALLAKIAATILRGEVER